MSLGDDSVGDCALRKGAVRRCPLTKADFRRLSSAAEWGTFLRAFEIRKTFEGFAEEYFEQALELGCGSGVHSAQLAVYCKHLTATDYDADKLTQEDNEKITFRVVDAQDLSCFDDDAMDLIYSSNMLEHVPDVDRCLRECRRVIKPGGLIVHSVPSNTWKTFKLLLFYPALMKAALRRLGGRRGGPSAPRGEVGGSTTTSAKRSRVKWLFPPTHGVANRHWKEFLCWREKRWMDVFRRSGLEVACRVRLPFYFGYGFQFPRLLRLGNGLGWSACTAYHLKEPTYGEVAGSAETIHHCDT